MGITKKVSFRCPENMYEASKDKAIKLNMTQSDYLNALIENDLRGNGLVINQRALIQVMCNLSTDINILAERYPEDECLRDLKEGAKLAWQIS